MQPDLPPSVPLPSQQDVKPENQAPEPDSSASPSGLQVPSSASAGPTPELPVLPDGNTPASGTEHQGTITASTIEPSASTGSGNASGGLPVSPWDKAKMLFQLTKPDDLFNDLHDLKYIGAGGYGKVFKVGATRRSGFASAVLQNLEPLKRSLHVSSAVVGGMEVSTCGCEAGAQPFSRAFQKQQLQGGPSVQGAVSLGRRMWILYDAQGCTCILREAWHAAWCKTLHASVKCTRLHSAAAYPGRRICKPPGCCMLQPTLHAHQFNMQ